MLYKGMEEAAQGMISMRAMQDVIANNLANANTVGFQEDTLLVSEFDEAYRTALEGGKSPVDFYPVPAGFTPAGGGVNGDVRLLFRTVTKFKQGTLKQTSQPFDLALNGKGFFTVQGHDGVRYTRNGSFALNGEGYLVDKEGGLILGEHGPIKANGGDFKVKPDGSVLVDGKLVDKLQISWLDTKKLEKTGSASFKAVNPMVWPSVERPVIMQGALEMSNVNAVKEMVHMLSVMRAYEASQKVLQTQDQMAQRANQVAQPK